MKNVAKENILKRTVVADGVARVINFKTLGIN